jgi:hypothetical protein
MERMSHHAFTPPPFLAEISAISGAAAVSITARNVSFVSTHAWVQDIMALVSFTAGMASILTFVVAGLIHLVSWIKKRS